MSDPLTLKILYFDMSMYILSGTSRVPFVTVQAVTLFCFKLKHTVDYVWITSRNVFKTNSVCRERTLEKGGG